MCAAAISFSGVGAVRFMAADPAFVGAVDGDRPPDANGPSYEGPADDRWIVTANLLFLHNIARTHVPAGSIVAANQHVEPETTGLVLDVVSEGLLTGAALHGPTAPGHAPNGVGAHPRSCRPAPAPPRSVLNNGAAVRTRPRR
jgi:hypothetical protein